MPTIGRRVIPVVVGLVTLVCSFILLNKLTYWFVHVLADVFDWRSAVETGVLGPLDAMWVLPIMTIVVYVSSLTLAGLVTVRTWTRLAQRPDC